ncbi:MAG: hypothetical protein KC503_14290 [Myxococcales bacterium]|nr:hypothetical protein [Myxococcales bacterium]
MRALAATAAWLLLCGCPGDKVNIDRVPVAPDDGGGEMAPREGGVDADGGIDAPADGRGDVAPDAPRPDGAPGEGGATCTAVGMPASCNPVTRSGCAQGDCYITPAGLACVCPPGNTPAGGNCTTSVQCTAGNVCQGTQPPGICRRICDVAQGSPCQANEICEPIAVQPMFGYCRPAGAGDGGGAGGG